MWVFLILHINLNQYNSTGRHHVGELEGEGPGAIPAAGGRWFRKSGCSRGKTCQALKAWKV